eukprot:TRINITY_DN4238_c3_g2_i1.p1 TRINITY_DN4238_c3_g2~~TRINITY_DN4238_c3_g2_i1.p1  ORF type:complete len:323 (+),score=45.18 TRINITY_DN4238_c3_g2_i1:96-1064(+)
MLKLQTLGLQITATLILSSAWLARCSSKNVCAGVAAVGLCSESSLGRVMLQTNSLKQTYNNERVMAAAAPATAHTTATTTFTTANQLEGKLLRWNAEVLAGFKKAGLNVTSWPDTLEKYDMAFCSATTHNRTSFERCALNQFRSLHPHYDPSSSTRRIALYGDSDIFRWILPENGQRADAVNVGVGGACVFTMADYAKEFMMKYQPHAVVIIGGENDMESGFLANQTFAQFSMMYNVLRSHPSLESIVYLGTKPEPEATRAEKVDIFREYDMLIKARFSSDPKFHFVDNWGWKSESYYQPDGEHVTPKGYHEWNKVLKRILG